MKTTQYLDAVKARLDIASDYGLAKALGVAKQTITHHRQHRAALGDELALRVAVILEIDPRLVLADVHAERAKDHGVRAVWRKMADAFASTAAALALVVVSVASLTASNDAAASPYSAMRTGTLLIMSTFTRLLRRLMASIRSLTRPPRRPSKWRVFMPQFAA